MNFHKGKKGTLRVVISFLIAIIVILSVLNGFSMSTNYYTMEEVQQEDITEPAVEAVMPKPHGVRAADPFWSSLSGSLPSTNMYTTIVFGDANHDGKPDVFTSSWDGTGIRCFVGDGNGGWTNESVGLPLTGSYTDIETADLNNDGKLDIASSDLGQGRIWTGNGGEGGSMVWTLESSPDPWYGIALGDVDNSGTIDIATGRSGGVYVFTNNLTFNWDPASNGLPGGGEYWGVDLGDVDNDGNLDLAAAINSNGGVRIWTGNGQTGGGASWTDAFTATGLPTSGNFAQVRLGDANNDGNLDIAAASDSGLRFFTGNGGSGGFTWTEESSGLPSGNFYGLCFADVNNDANLDIIAAENPGSGGVRVWLGDGGAGGSMDWTPGMDGLPTGYGVFDICVGDVNNDGAIDIGASTQSNGVQVWGNNLPALEITGWTSASTNLPTGSGWYDVVFGDIDHDGKLDLAGAGSSFNGVGVWTGDGTGIWTPVSDPDLPSNGYYNGVRLCDINHDGDLDLIASSDDNLRVLVWPGDGSGGFGPNTGPLTPNPAPDMGGVEVTDINSDGNVDVASSRYNPNGGDTDDKVYAWLGDGTGGWGSDIGPTEDLGYDDIAFGDVNHDGAVDLFATAHMNGYRFWLGDGIGGWTLQPQNGLPSSSGIGGLGVCFDDVNHDGNLDAAVGSWAGSYGVRVYTSDGGAGGAVDWTNASVGLPTVGTYGGVELGDINNDGNLDILSANAGGGQSDGISLTLGNGGFGGSMIWTDALLPDLPSSGNYWGVDFGDVNIDGILDIAIASSNGIWVYITQTQPSTPVNLLEGWNLISLPKIQSDTNVNSVLSSISGDYKAVQSFDTADSNDPWKHYNPQKPMELNDLSDLDHTMGIWIYVTQPGGTTLSVFGDNFTLGQSIVIRLGWNLVGYPSLTNRLRDTALNNTASDVDWVGYFDAVTDRFVPLTGSDDMKVGRGYWIHSTNPAIILWNVPL